MSKDGKEINKPSTVLFYCSKYYNKRFILQNSMKNLQPQDC